MAGGGGPCVRGRVQGCGLRRSSSAAPTPAPKAASKRGHSATGHSRPSAARSASGSSPPPPSPPPPSSPPPPPAQSRSDSPSATPDTATKKALEAEESAIEGSDEGLGLPIGVACGALVLVALGVVLFLLRRRKQKQLQLVTLAGAAGSSSGNEPNKAQHASKEATAAKDSEASEAGGEAAVVI